MLIGGGPMQLQEHKQMFSTAKYTMRKSYTGLYILLFWPTSSVKPVPILPAVLCTVYI